jgi:hypothetical protein
MYYSLAAARSEFHQSLLNCLACCFQSVPELRRDAERLGRSPSKCSTDCCG